MVQDRGKNRLTEEVLGGLVAILSADQRVLSVYLHGSAVRGELREESDVDLALLLSSEHTLPGMERLEMAFQLEKICGRRVDIGLLNGDQLIYASQAILQGRRIYCRNSTAADLRVATLLGLYLDLKSDRRVVEDAYAAR